MIAIVVLGLLAFSGTGECTISGWATPSETGATPAATTAAILTLAEGYTGTFYTFAATSDVAITSYTMTQTPNTGIFEIATASTGVLTLASGKVLDYETSESHVLIITAIDATTTGSVTVTIVVTNVAPAFALTTQTINVADATAASTTVATLTATDVGATTTTLTYAISAASNTNTDFAIAAGGVITTAKVLAAATTASYSLVLTAADSGTTVKTGTTTLVVCVGCGAAGLAAGVLSLITLSLAMLK